VTGRASVICTDVSRCKQKHKFFQAIGKDASACKSRPQVMLLTKSCACGAADSFASWTDIFCLFDMHLVAD
jgi:hypothetical protein